MRIHIRLLISRGIFTDDSGRFPSFFRRILSMSLDDSQLASVRTQLLSFLISAFQSLDNGIIRKECAPLVSISIWQYLHNESAREQKFKHHTPLKKAWRAASKRYESADDLTKSQLRFERAWLYSMILDFTAQLYRSGEGNVGSNPRLVPLKLTLYQMFYYIVSASWSF